MVLLLLFLLFLLLVVLFLSGVLSLKRWSSKASWIVEGTLTWPVKQPYSICCLTGHVFEGVQWGNENNRKTRSRNISSPLRTRWGQATVWIVGTPSSTPPHPTPPQHPLLGKTPLINNKGQERTFEMKERKRERGLLKERETSKKEDFWNKEKCFWNF